MAYLTLIRHGQSEWNITGLWTGWRDISLTDVGREEARRAGEALRDIHFDHAYVSNLIRAQQTLDEVLQVLGQKDVPVTRSEALNERNYGELTGKNKWEIREQYGEEQFLRWRRGWDEKVPGGETLKDVYDRVVPYFENEILPKLKAGQHVILVAHGNSLRALVKYIETISDEMIPSLEIATGEAYVYQYGEDGHYVDKQIRVVNPNLV
jgi:2,3-bisphosphoglycerate-dependent phosphoglycerate mutase